MKPMCCFIPCDKSADWSIVYGRTPDDYTEACQDHVGVMLEQDTVNIVTPIEELPELPKLPDLPEPRC